MWIDQLYIVEENKSIKKEDSPQSMWPSSDLDTVLAAFHYPSADNKLEQLTTGGFWEFWTTRGHRGVQSGHLGQTDSILSVNQVIQCFVWRLTQEFQ